MARMKRQPTGSRAFLASPRTYQIDRAVRELETDWWTTKGKPVRRGDRALFWRATGPDGRRGIIAFGQIISDPEMRPDSDNPFWLEAVGAAVPEERVRVRYVDAPRLPLWLDEDNDGVLEELSIAKATRGTVFYVTQEQWDAVVRKAGGWRE